MGQYPGDGQAGGPMEREGKAVTEAHAQVQIGEVAGSIWTQRWVGVGSFPCQ